MSDPPTHSTHILFRCLTLSKSTSFSDFRDNYHIYRACKLFCNMPILVVVVVGDNKFMIYSLLNKFMHFLCKFVHFFGQVFPERQKPPLCLLLECINITDPIKKQDLHWPLDQLKQERFILRQYHSLSLCQIKYKSK